MTIQTVIKGLGVLTLFTLSASAMAMGNYPACQPIVQACKAAGFVKGGPVGHRLYKDCAKPILMHQAAAAGSLALPMVNPTQVAACNAQRSGHPQPATPSTTTQPQ